MMPAVFARQIAVLGAVAIVVAATAVMPTRSASPWVVYNASGSAQLGWYRVVRCTPTRGDTAVVRPSQAHESALVMATHHPPNTPLLKRVAAVFADRVCRVGALVLINGRTVGKAFQRDQTGRPLPVWEGCVTLELGQFFLLNDHPFSFDSRYFGPVSEGQIIGVAQPIWTWNPAD
jgi:conjugative transfer signal peptidase TraF